MDTQMVGRRKLQFGTKDRLLIILIASWADSKAKIGNNKN